MWIIVPQNSQMKYPTFFSRFSPGVSCSRDWRDVRLGVMFTITPDVVDEKLYEVMDSPPKHTSCRIALMILWIRFSIGVLI